MLRAITAEVAHQIRSLSKDMKLAPFYNFATLDDAPFEGFFRVYFDRNDSKAVAKAHQWNAAVHELMEQRLGIYPYRLNIKQMPKFVERSDDGFWQVVKKIKTALDLQQILAQGRYSTY